MNKAPSAGNPKLCPKCGMRGMCFDTRMVTDYVKRRYRCSVAECGVRWGTAEFFINEGSSTKRGKIEDYRRAEARKHVGAILVDLQEALK